jgi:hypothetical protein
MVLGKKTAAPDQARRLTAQQLEQDHADPQLAAALTALSGRLAKGTYTPVGKTRAAMQAILLRREVIKQAREELQKNLDKLEKELEGLEKQVGNKEK